MIAYKPAGVWYDSSGNFGDWCAPKENPADANYGFGNGGGGESTSQGVVGSVLQYQAMEITSKIAALLGYSSDAAYYRGQADLVKANFNAAHLNADGHYSTGRQTTSILPLTYGLVEDADFDKVAEYFTNRVKVTNDSHLQTGIFGSQGIVDALVMVGQTDLAYDVLTNPTYPGWGFQITEFDATTAWEQWSWAAGMQTHDHAMFAGVNESFYTQFGGIQSTAAGYATIDIKPAVPSQLEWVKTTQETVRGKVASAWKQSGDGFTLEVTIPVNSTANIYVPVESNDVLLPPDDAVYVGTADGYAQYTVGSGDYTFKTERVDKTDLQTSVTDAGALTPGDYTTSTWADAQTKLTEAQGVLTDANALQGAVDSAQTALDNAVAALQRRGDPADLQTMVNAVTPMDTSGFTDATATALASALAAAQNALVNAADRTQPQLDAAKSALLNALVALKAKPGTPEVRTEITEVTKPVPSGKQAVVTRVKFGQSVVTLAKGKSFLLRPGVYFTKGTPTYATGVTYKSSNSKIAKVDKYGQVKALKPGLVKITATSKLANAKGKKVSASYTVRVVKKASKAKVKAVTLPKLPKSMKVGQTLWLTGSYSTGIQSVRVTYSTKSFRIATIDQAGRLIALNKGKETVTVKAGGKTKKYTLTVK
jgi:hypothetical protein